MNKTNGPGKFQYYDFVVDANNSGTTATNTTDDYNCVVLFASAASNGSPFLNVGRWLLIHRTVGLGRN